MKTLTQSRAIELLRNGEAQLKIKGESIGLSIYKLLPDFPQSNINIVSSYGNYLTINDYVLHSRESKADLPVIKLKNIVSDDYVGKKGEKACKCCKEVINFLYDFLNEKSKENLEKRQLQYEIALPKEKPASTDQPKLEVGKWYKRPHNKALFFVTSDPEKQPFKIYGFDNKGEWMAYDVCQTFTDGEVLATPDEIQTALTNEAVKRGIVKGAWIDRSELELGEYQMINNDSAQYYYSDEDNSLRFNGVIIFKNGTWSKPIQTISKEEAERRTGCKIV